MDRLYLFLFDAVFDCIGEWIVMTITEREYSKKWILDNPLLFIESLFEFLNKYHGRYYSISQTTGFVTIHATIEHSVEDDE